MSFHPHGYHPSNISETTNRNAQTNKERFDQKLKAKRTPGGLDFLKDNLSPKEYELYVGKMLRGRIEDKVGVARKMYDRAMARRELSNGKSIWFGDRFANGSRPNF